MDSILYRPNGEEVDRDEYDQVHERVLALDSWIIEGFGPMNSMASFNRRLEAADTLIYIDFPYWVTYWLVTKRCIKGLLIKPEGWPEGSSVLKGTLQSYKVLRLCPAFWNDAFLSKLEKLSVDKELYVIRSIADLNRFIEKHVK